MKRTYLAQGVLILRTNFSEKTERKRTFSFVREDVVKVRLFAAGGDDEVRATERREASFVTGGRVPNNWPQRG